MPAYLRVNGEMLGENRGREVCLLGKLEKIMPDHMSFEITTPDDRKVLIKCKVPIRDSLSEIVEVYGSVDEKGNIACTNFATFDQSMIQNFDMSLYNEAVKVIYEVPKHYAQWS